MELTIDNIHAIVNDRVQSHLLEHERQASVQRAEAEQHLHTVEETINSIASEVRIISKRLDGIDQRIDGIDSHLNFQRWLIVGSTAFISLLLALFKFVT